MSTFYVLRHGDILNPHQVVYLRMDQEIPLSDLGKQQVAIQAERLRTCHIQAIYYSPLWRTKQSAHILESVLKTNHLIPEPKLLEVINPQQGTAFHDFDRRYHGDLYHPDLIAQGGETIPQVAERMMSVVQQIAHQNPNQSIVLVSHGDPIKTFWLISDSLAFNKQNLGSERFPIPGVPYPAKGSVSVFQHTENQLTRTDY